MENQAINIEVDAYIPEHPSVTFTSTGPQGGDAGHGGRAELAIEFGGGSHEVIVERWEDGRWVPVLVDTDAGDEGLRLRVVSCGDWELDGLTRAIKRIGRRLPGAYKGMNP